MRPKNQETINGILKFIDDYSNEYNSAPTAREIAAALGVNHSTVTRYMQQLREEGRIDYSGHRSVVLEKAKQRYSNVPVVGTIACGGPILAEENIEEYMRLPESFLGSGDYFILRAKGDSMINAGIDDGDMVIVRAQNNARYNQIVVALIGEEATLKRFRPEKGIIKLHAENPYYNDIIPEHCAVQGVAVKVLKDLI